jgi:CBS domain-containing protein
MFEKLNVGDICNRAVVIATEDMSLKEAAGLMRDQQVGSLVVVRPAELGNLVTGMLTDRDIAIVAVARDFDPQTLRVSDVMASDIVTVRPNASIHEALSLMRQHGMRRLPVTTAAGALVGLVTLDDLLEVFAEELQGFVQAIAVEQRHEVRMR